MHEKSKSAPKSLGVGGRINIAPHFKVMHPTIPLISQCDTQGQPRPHPISCGLPVCLIREAQETRLQSPQKHSLRLFSSPHPPRPLSKPQSLTSRCRWCSGSATSLAQGEKLQVSWNLRCSGVGVSTAHFSTMHAHGRLLCPVWWNLTHKKTYH